MSSYFGEHCFACSATEGLALSTCCNRLCCGSHRFGDGSIASGFTCSDHPFGMQYETKPQPLATYRKSRRHPLLWILLWAVPALLWTIFALLLSRR